MKKRIDTKEYCSVCGLNIYKIKGYSPWEDGEYPSFSCCSSCWVEFGYEDSTFESTKDYRIEWITKGMRWEDQIQLDKKDSSPNNTLIPTPPNWNPITQLKNIGIDFNDSKTVEEYKKDIPNIEEIIKKWL